MHARWMSSGADSFLNDPTSRISSIRGISLLAYLNEQTQKQWEYLDADAWKILEQPMQIAGQLPFIVNYVNKEIVVRIEHGSFSDKSLEQKMVEAAYVIAAVDQAYFRVRTTSAPMYQEMHQYFLEYIRRTFAHHYMDDASTESILEVEVLNADLARKTHERLAQYLFRRSMASAMLVDSDSEDDMLRLLSHEALMAWDRDVDH